MNREEYEEIKSGLLSKRESVDKELNDLARDYYNGLFSDAKDKFEGKYSIIFSESSLTKFSIYHIKKVVYVNDTTIEFMGDKWYVSYEFGERCSCEINYAVDTRIAVSKSYLRISSKEECKNLLDSAKIYNQSLFDKFK